MSDDNIFTITPKVDVKYDDLEERIYNCFHAAISFNMDHQKNCIYCINNQAVGDMVFEILAKDMTLAAQNKNLALTTFDMKQALAITLMRINDTEYELSKEETEEAGTRGSGSGGGHEVGDQTPEETGTTVEEGVIEIGSYRKRPKEDRET